MFMPLAAMRRIGHFSGCPGMRKHVNTCLIMRFNILLRLSKMNKNSVAKLAKMLIISKRGCFVYSLPVRIMTYNYVKEQKFC